MINDDSKIAINIHGHELEISGSQAVGAFVIAVLVSVFCLGVLLGQHISNI